MHDTTPGSTSTRIQGDHWLSNTIPMILASAAYTNGGAIFVTWDEGSVSGGPVEDDGPIGMIVVSPHGKGGGYTNKISYNHSSTLRTMQDIFGVRPYLGDAARANDLSDLFRIVKLSAPATITNRQFRYTATNLFSGKTNIFQYTTNLATTNGWTGLFTNVVATNSYNYIDTKASNSPYRFYRVIQLP